VHSSIRYLVIHDKQELNALKHATNDLKACVKGKQICMTIRYKEPPDKGMFTDDVKTVL